MDSCGESFVKYLMLFINFMFALAGMFLIGVGTYIQVTAKTYLDFLSDNYLNTPIFIIIVGLVIFVVAFFGCCGAWKESSCMIYTYAVLISVLLICEFGAAIAAFMLKGDLKAVIDKKFTEGLQNYKEPGYDGVTKTWDTIQVDFECCGVNNYTDWTNSGKQVPNTCCKSIPEGQDTCDVDNYFSRGCLVKFEGEFLDNIALVGGVALGVAVLQLIGVVFSCCLAGRIRKSGRYERCTVKRGTVDPM